MNVDQMMLLSPRERFVQFVLDREDIRLKKEAGETGVLSDNEILNAYRFCNIRRMDDRVSKWILSQWYVPNRGHRNMALACAIARWINYPDTLAEIGFPRVWNPAQVKKVLDARVKAGKQIINAAYIVPGEQGKSKFDTILYTYAVAFGRNLPVIDTNSMEQTWKNLCECRGLGSFLAGQVVADMRWAIEGEWKDRLVWAPKGPGSVKGMNYFMGRPPETGIKQEQFEKELLVAFQYFRERLPASIVDRLEMHDIQSCMCEFSKLSRTLEGTGKPKQLYRRR